MALISDDMHTKDYFQNEHLKFLIRDNYIANMFLDVNILMCMLVSN